MSWDRIDVSFSGSRQKYVAHNAIQADAREDRNSACCLPNCQGEWC